LWHHFAFLLSSQPFSGGSLPLWLVVRFVDVCIPIWMLPIPLRTDAWSNSSRNHPGPHTLLWYSLVYPTMASVWSQPTYICYLMCRKYNTQNLYRWEEKMRKSGITWPGWLSGMTSMCPRTQQTPRVRVYSSHRNVLGPQHAKWKYMLK